MQSATLAQAATVVGVDLRTAPVLLPRLAGEPAADVDGHWSAGRVVAVAVVRVLDPHCVRPERWSRAARAVGDAHGRGLCPVYLVITDDGSFGVVLDGVDADRAAARAVVELARSGQVVRTVPVAPIVERLSDVLEDSTSTSAGPTFPGQESTT